MLGAPGFGKQPDKHGLFKAAESNYPPALYNLFIAYRFGYLGEVDFQKAMSYRARWLESLGTASSLYDLGLGRLGAWKPVTDPRASPNPPANFIFTGSFAAQNRARRSNRWRPRSFRGPPARACPPT